MYHRGGGCMVLIIIGTIPIVSTPSKYPIGFPLVYIVGT